MTTGDVDYQREVTRILLKAVGIHGFALAGSGAIREHGLTERPTKDVDLFTSDLDTDAFDAAVQRAADALTGRGYVVIPVRRSKMFARWHVTGPDDSALEIDFGVDWRGAPPVRLDIGPVLAVEDAIGNKVGALFSRGEIRDFLDVDAIRESNRYSDEQLLAWATHRDEGFDILMFAERLASIQTIGNARSAQYGVTPTQHSEVQNRLLAWAVSLRTTNDPAT